MIYATFEIPKTQPQKRKVRNARRRKKAQKYGLPRSKRAKKRWARFMVEGIEKATADLAAYIEKKLYQMEER